MFDPEFIASRLESRLGVTLAGESSDKINDGEGWRHLRRGIVRVRGQVVHGARER